NKTAGQKDLFILCILAPCTPQALQDASIHNIYYPPRRFIKIVGFAGALLLVRGCPGKLRRPGEIIWENYCRKNRCENLWKKSAKNLKNLAEIWRTVLKICENH
ncbi:MAG: hypothetical protein LBL46_01130, partial [Rickettsiales bacterium]|nr:hypothetical protein [Rickettsiales bacterium]